MRLALSVLAGVLAAAVPWALRFWRERRWGLPARITVDPDQPSAAALAEYLDRKSTRLNSSHGY